MVAERQTRMLRERRRRRTIGAAIVLVVVVVGAALGTYGWWLSHRSPTATPVAGASRVAFAPVAVTVSQPIRIGAADAPNTVTVYLDFQCSHCRDFEAQFAPTLTRLQDSGKVAVEYWPLAFINQQSPLASSAFRCAAEIEPAFGREFHDAVFANYGTTWDNAKFVTLGRSLRPDAPASFDTCVTTGSHTGWSLDITKAAFAGPAKNGTPTVYVNGVLFPLDRTPQQLEGMLK